MRLSTAPLPPLLTTILLLLFPSAAHAWVDPTTGLPHASHVTRPAQIPERDWLPGHRGVDLALEPGDEVKAAGHGVVTFVGVIVGVPTVAIDHAGGIRTTYQPVTGASISKGSEVREGQVIGRLGRNREHDGLHWGAKTGLKSYVDPLTLLAPPVIHLKAVTPADAPGRRRS